MEPKNGLVAVIINELSNPSQVSQSQSQWDPYFSVKASYVDHLTRFLRHFPTKELLYSLSMTDMNVKRVKRQLRNGDSEFSEEESDLIMRCSLEVSGSGYPEIDGSYQFHRVFHGAGMYVKMGVFTAADGTVDDSAKFCIFKCPVRTKTKQWFLSVVPADTEPGTAKDVDFFYQHDSEHKGMIGRTLPPSVWNIYEKRDSAGGVMGAGRTEATVSSLPSPRLELVFSWEDPELQSIGEELLVSASQSQQQHSTGYASESSAYRASHTSYGGSNYRRDYEQQQGGSWDGDDLYDESKVYDGSDYIYRE